MLMTDTSLATAVLTTRPAVTTVVARTVTTVPRAKAAVTAALLMGAAAAEDLKETGREEGCRLDEKEEE